jgi:hypothetical protein
MKYVAHIFLRGKSIPSGSYPVQFNRLRLGQALKLCPFNSWNSHPEIWTRCLLQGLNHFF